MVILYFRILVTVVHLIFLEPIQMLETIRLQEYGEMAECLCENEFLHDLHLIDIMELLVIFERIQTCFLFQILASLVQDLMYQMVDEPIFFQYLLRLQVVLRDLFSVLQYSQIQAVKQLFSLELLIHLYDQLLIDRFLQYKMAE